MVQQERRYPRLGEQITRLVRSLAAAKGWNMARAMSDVCDHINYSTDMVHHWRQGRSIPPVEAIKNLVRIGKDDANLPREWGESFLKAAHYPNALRTVNELWGPKEERKIPCNLPNPEHTDLIGRQKEIAELLELLSAQYAAHLITVDGIGGVGKTALVLEVAYRCWKSSIGEVSSSRLPHFDAIIFVSAKQQFLTAEGLLPKSEAQRTLSDIFRDVAHTLNRYDITYTAPQEQPSRVREALGRQQTLLIVDNLETMEDKQEILSFLFSLPPSVKAVITTRERAMYSPIRLEQLGKEEALNLIRKQAREKQAHVSKEEAVALYRHIGGIPAALVYAIGQLASGYSVETVCGRVSQAGGDVARFCFEESVDPLRGKPAHHLLMAMAMFPKDPLSSAIAHTAGLGSDPIAVEEGLAQLQRLSLISQQERRYRMLPLTREYALAELATRPDFELEARQRWVVWYLKFTEEYGGRDWKEWHIQYDHVVEEWENLLAVFDWCRAHEQYREMLAFWLGGGVCQLAHVYGFWNDKLTWLTWLIQAAERRGDWATVVEARKDKGYTLTLMGELEEAEQHFRRAWDLHKYADPKVQVYLAQEFAAHHVHQRRFPEALSWLDQAELLLNRAQLPKLEHTRAKINSQRYYGFTYYEEQKYEEAERYFRAVVEQAQEIGWQRAITYAENFLANIAIAQNRLEEADRLLQQGLTVAKRNKDQRRTAAYKRSLAYFYKERGNLEKALYWANEALDGYERLGMHGDLEEMHNLLQQLQA